MRRIAVRPRPDWVARCEDVGFTFHSVGGCYWDESAAYEFSLAEIERIEAASAELHAMSLQAVAWVIEHDQFHRYKLAPNAIELVTRSWQRREPSLYGRFDFSWHGKGDPKLLEYNADTPTSLLEASVVQWFWLQDVFPTHDQFNSIHEKLITRWTALRADWPLVTTVHFASMVDSEEDAVNALYLADTAAQVGLSIKPLAIEHIGYDNQRRCFVDLDDQRISHCFKLYPWEWMLQDEFSRHIAGTDTLFLEPAWKLLLSSKALLPILWELFPNHPNLLPASAETTLTGNVVRKPLFSREGANITLMHGDQRIESAGPYGNEGYIYQAAAPLPRFDDQYAVVTSWIIGDEAAGIGIREDATPITRDTSHFVPHYLR